MLESASQGGFSIGGVLHWGGSPSGGVLHLGGGVLHLGGFSIRGGSPSRGGRGHSPSGGVSPSRGGMASQHALRQTPSPRGQTHTCKNITLATTSLRPVKITLEQQLRMQPSTELNNSYKLTQPSIDARTVVCEKYSRDV